MASEHFSDKELACKHCGEIYEDTHALNLLEQLRTEVGPLVLTSAHRCGIHNALIKGAPLSLHKKLAFDVSVTGLNRFKLFYEAKKVGFTGFGLGQSFLHLDTRARAAIWDYGKVSQQLWQGVLS